MLPGIGMAQPDRDEVGAHEHVGDIGELAEQPRDARIVRITRRLVPPARPVVDRGGDEANRARIGSRFGNHGPVEGLAEWGAGGRLETERSVTPPELQYEAVIQLVSPPTVSRPDE